MLRRVPSAAKVILRSAGASPGPADLAPGRAPGSLRISCPAVREWPSLFCAVDLRSKRFFGPLILFGRTPSVSAAIYGGVGVHYFCSAKPVVCYRISYVTESICHRSQIICISFVYERVAKTDYLIIATFDCQRF